jgi:hypothetical protein
MTNACPLVFNVFLAMMSSIEPNCEKMAYSDFLRSATYKAESNKRKTAEWTTVK